jgi:hypothetical protein
VHLLVFILNNKMHGELKLKNVNELSGYVNFLTLCQVLVRDEARNLKTEDVMMWCLFRALTRLKGR